MKNFEQNFIENDQENISESSGDKRKKWQEEREKLDNIGDKLGHPIDKNIKDVVTSFIVNGVPTTSSCEGHIDIEDGKEIGRSPYITLGFNNSGDDYVGEQEIIEKIRREMGISKEEIWSEEFHRRFYGYIENPYNKVEKTSELEEVIRKNSKIGDLLYNVIEDFYRGREVDDGKKIKIKILLNDDNGVHLSFENKPENKEELEVQQAEMQALGDFLRERFFSF